jgi:ribosomal protein S18 acetylase RimI-like enzyme
MKERFLKLRLARPTDAPVLAILSRDLIETGLGWQYDARRLRRLIEHRETLSLVACEGPVVVGFSIMEFGDETAHLVLLAVRPTYQRRGVARRMFEWLMDSAATAGIASVHLELRASNEVARAFYRAMGFAETMLIRGYYGGQEAALRMVRLLRTTTAPAFLWRPPTLDRS